MKSFWPFVSSTTNRGVVVSATPPMPPVTFEHAHAARTPMSPAVRAAKRWWAWMLVPSALLIACGTLGFLLFFGTPSPRPGTFRSFRLTASGPLGVVPLDSAVATEHVRISRTEKGDWLVESFDQNAELTTSLKATLTTQGLLQSTRTEDKYGIVVEAASYQCAGRGECLAVFRNPDGRNTREPCSSVSLRWSRGGWVETTTCLDRQGKPRIGEDGVAIATREHVRFGKNKGLTTSISYFDERGNPLSDRAGCQTESFAWTSRGCLGETRCWGPEERPAVRAEGMHRTAYSSTEGCMTTGTEHFGPEGERATDNYGVHRYEMQVARGNTEKEARYDAESKPVRSLVDGAHVVRFSYSKQGKLITKSFFSQEDQKIDSLLGYHSEHRTYDVPGLVETQYYLDVNDRPVRDPMDVHKYFFKHDGRGQVILQAYFGPDGNPTLDGISKVHMVKYEHDANGRVSRYTYWLNESVPMDRWSGVHGYVDDIDSSGHQVASTSIDEAGATKAESTGTSVRRYRHGDDGLLVSRSVFLDRTPVLIAGAAQVAGYHEIRTEYDSLLRVSALSYWDTSLRPTDALVSSTSLVHRVEFIWQGSKLMEQRWFRVNSSVPAKTLNCVKDPCMLQWGIGLQKQ